VSAIARREADGLPPHSLEVEEAALGCVLLAGIANSEAEVDALLMQLKPAMFYDHRTRTVHAAMTRLRMDRHAVDDVTLFQWLKEANQVEDAGGVAYFSKLSDKVPSLMNFPTYLDTLKKFSLRRWTLGKATRLTEMGNADTLTVDDLQSEFADLSDKSQRIGNTGRARLKVWRPADILNHVPNPNCQLVGDNEIFTGYEGITVVAGPGSSGKSLAVLALALAGARGEGLWMGRKVHRKFKTLMIQAENGARRLKEDIGLLIKHHPELRDEIHESIFITDPPEGGLPFHHHDFRAAVRRACDEFKPDLVVVDPWSQVASEDGQKEVVEKLTEIRSCFPGGDDCPALLIIAHTKKPRADEVRKGRALVHTIMGSAALPNTARCVYMLLPWTEEPEDTRIFWACVKLNDGEMYAPTVWFRKRGTFFEHDGKTDARDWGKEGDDERRAITEAQLRDCFEKSPTLKKGALVKALSRVSGASEPTCYRALDEDGYLRAFLMRDGAGGLKLKD
jgi:hypothetical protein